MSLTDPASITISGTPISLPRTDVGEDRSEYTSGDGLVQLTISHQYAKRTRRMIRIDTNKITADPFKPAENVKVGMGVYSVFDLPPAGYTATEAKAVWDGYIAMLAASSAVMVTKVLGGES
jgi:hypothetical protein